MREVTECCHQPEPSTTNRTLPNRRRFLQSAATGAGSMALWAGVGSASDAAVAAPPQPPGWVPASGGAAKAVATTNTFLSQNGKLVGWEYAFGKIVDDYSGGVFNPYWGPLGAMVFHGGGHAATFDNSVVILDFNDLTFKRLSNPTPSNKGANWISTAGLSQNVDPAFNSYCEYGDGQPGAGHTYDTLAILPPADGGAPFGSLIRVSSFAVHVNLSRSTGWAHRFDFQSMAMRNGKWVRWSVNGPTNYLFPGACSAYDSRRKRFWWMAALSYLPPMIRYLDVATQQQLEAPYARTARLAPAADSGSMTLRYDPARDILVLTCTLGGKLVLAFLRCASPEMGWVVPPLSASIPAQPGASHPFDFVPEADKFVLLTGADNSALYDIKAPQDPTLVWTVTRRPLVGVAVPTAHIAGKRWSYAPAVKSFVWMASSSSGVIAYRPFV
ncbi:Twin-arginine translocation pathway signal [Rhodoferax ferrireducens T118]|uniref:Twin-arginine translocation pathway signal n=2 Tax=Rhodoferax ferrireducens TaxID=192843 RepID=Q220X1_ALBFT|nr:Twin-arginine translocation pathway signal [Rhodoferax ferrireducens T118]